MSPTGNDANSGTSASPWATPNHNVVCGDVIIAAPGAYKEFGYFGTVSSCPSTSGGVDGTGGVYFATVLCGGAYVGDCSITATGGVAFGIAKSNWAVEGWQASIPKGRAFFADAGASDTTIIHHVAFINDIAYNSDDGFTTGDAGRNHNVPGNGVDQFAVVGSIAQNTAQDPICVAAIDDPGPANYDNSSGTHVFWAGNFVFSNLQPAGCVSDGEGMMLDTFDAHGYKGQSAIENNIVWQSQRMGLQIFYQNYNVSAANMLVFNNTFFSNNAGKNAGANYAIGDINVQSTTSKIPYSISIYNNIAQTNFMNIGNVVGSGVVYAALTGGAYGVSWGGSGKENIFKGLATNCLASCNAGRDVIAFNGGSYGANIYMSPAFSNTADLLANRSGAPNCSGYANVAACMGWNGSSARNPSVIYDLTPTASGTAGKGYQPPGPCNADPYFPTWLKGVVYLKWNGTSITENGGLITKPCGM